MSEIQSLAARVEQLARDVDWWNTAMIWALVFAAIAAVAVVITTRMALVRTGQLSDAQNSLMQAKEGQLALDLKEKDAKILGLERDVGVQEERAANAERSLLELRERIKPRHLSSAEQKALTAKLLPFAGQMSMLITLAGDAEIAGIGKDLTAAIEAARWALTTVSGNAPMGEVRSGIMIEFDPEAPDSAVRAANALGSALRTAGLAIDGPKPGTRTLALQGATVNGPLRVGDINLITVTIAKKP